MSEPPLILLIRELLQLKSDIQEYYASKENKPRLSIPKKQNASKSIYCNRPYKVAESHERTVTTRKNVNKKLNKNISNLESWKSGLNALMALSLIFAVLFAILFFTGGEIQVAISCLGLGSLVFSLSRIMADARIHYCFATILLIATMSAK